MDLKAKIPDPNVICTVVCLCICSGGRGVIFHLNEFSHLLETIDQDKKKYNFIKFFVSLSYITKISTKTLNTI